MNFNTDNLRQEIESYYEKSNTADHFFLEKIVESLKYYGTGGEGIEMFRATCELAYQQYGIGDTWKAILLVDWAREQAEESAKWSNDPDDFEMGWWGYQ